MKISITQKEYARLLELAYMGMWVATSHDEELDDARPGRYEAVYQMLLRNAPNMGCANLVQGDPDSGEPMEESQELENGRADELIEKFENDCFWDELCDRLAERDLERECAREPLSPGMPCEENYDLEMDRMDALSARYRDEFVKHELDNVIVLFGSDRLS
ncbi:MAG: hypothetical protein LBI02_09600 [Opitutaceae bacterium]|jgi:hypothetical protein|nr:hypothetical protein [Opitutaceae bacterium]